MERPFETVMIEQCAPTLAGLKAASLFRQESHDRAALVRQVKDWDIRLAPKGIRVIILKAFAQSPHYLIYVYRPARLGELLSRPESRRFLEHMGYHLPGDPAGESGQKALLAQLRGRLRREGEFPHEIGLFLDYPLQDVEGFIQNRGQNFTCLGCWKSYSDPDTARRIFDQLDKCRRIYLQLFRSGRSILRLAVAA